MFKKRLFSVLLCLFVALQLMYIPAIKVQAATGPQINYTTSGDTTVGSTFTINVNLSNATDVYSASVNFAYDPTLIQIVSVDKGDFWTGSNATIVPVDSTSNVAKIAISMTKNTTGITKASGTIAVIKAKVLKAGTINLKTTSDSSAFSQTGNNVLVKVANSEAYSIGYTGVDSQVNLLAIAQPLTAGKYEENNANIKLVGTWKTDANAGYSGGNIVYSSVAGDSIQFSFTGTGFRWSQPVNIFRGIAKITIDGNTYTADSYSATTILQKVVYEKNDLTFDTHTVKIEVTSTKSTSSSGTAQAFDYVEILNQPQAAQPLTAGKYEENNANIKLVGAWKTDANTGYSGGNIVYSSVAGDSIQFSFTGTGFRWSEPVNIFRGIAKITIDGTTYTADAYSATTILQKVVYEKNDLTFGTHTVKIEVTSTKSTSSSGTAQAFDYVEILNQPQAAQPLTAGKYEENNSNIKLVGTWKTDANTGYSGGNIVYSSVAGDSIQFSFTGTGFRWSEPVNIFRGIAKITIDGTTYTTDAYSATTILQKVVYEKNDLTFDTHTVKIEVTSTKSTSSSGNAQAFDYIEVLNQPQAAQPLTAGKYEENNANIKLVGAWKTDANTGYSGGNIVYSSVAGDSIQFSFTGTGFRWSEPVNIFRGIAKITVDGTTYTADSYSATTILQKIVYEKNDLTFGTHTVKIEVTSTKSTSSSGTAQAFDYVEILNQ